MKSLNKRRVIGVFSLIVFMLFFIFSNSSKGMQVYQKTDFVTGIVTAKNLNVRQGPGLKYKVVTKISKNEYVRVFAQIGKWYIIQTDKDYIGAVSKEYIKAIYPSNSEENEEKKIESKNTVTQKTEEKQEQSENQTDTKQNVEKMDNEKTTEQAEENGESVQQSQNTEVSLTDLEKEVLNMINEERKEQGIAELKTDEDIQNVARVKAEEMEEKGYFEHTSPTYGNILEMLERFSIKHKVAGENIAGNSTAQGAVAAWINSDSHKVNVLSNGYNYTGIGVANSSKYGKIFVQIFVGR